MKTEIKHYAAYLPYAIMVEANVPGYNCNMRLIGIEERTTWNVLKLRNGDFDTVVVNMDRCKPILRPLSDLTVEIECNGKKIIAIKELLGRCLVEITHYRALDHESTLSYDNIRRSGSGTFYINHRNILKELYHWQIQKLLEWHFDIFGLIEKGLAIPLPNAVETLTKTTNQ